MLSLGLACVGLAFDGSTESSDSNTVSALPTQTSTNVGKGVFSGYLQEQYFSTDQATKSSGFFRNRRTRLNYTHQIDEKTMGRFSVEFAAGTNQTTAQVRDAFIQYKPNGYSEKSGPTITFGSQNLPLGYEIGYSTPNINWLERSVYEQTFFNSESGKGLIFQNGTASNYWFVGAIDSLTVNDPEQADVATKGEVMPVAGVRGKIGAWEGGLSGMSGKRPSYSVGAVNLTSTDRRFFYADLRWHPENSKLDIRSEYMVGKDRIPLAATSAANPTSGGHLNIDYKLTGMDTVVGRYETFDRNTDVSGDIQTLYGLAFVRDVSKNLRLQMGCDWNKNPYNSSGQQAYKTFTFRVLIKF